MDEGRGPGHGKSVDRQGRAIGLLWLAVTVLSAASAGATQASDGDRPILRAGRLEGTLRLDGHLDEPAWSSAEGITNLTQIDPKEGAEPTARTTVTVLADANQLWFGIVANDPDPSGIVAYDVRRDAILRDEDHIRIVLDPFLDGRSGVVFMVNPNGARYDALVSQQGEGENSDWDAIWAAKAVRTPEGWSAEIWIPVRSLTFKPGIRRWGLNVERRIQRLQETDRWASPERDYEFNQTSRAGLLVALPEFEVGRGFSVRPSLFGGVESPGRESDTEVNYGGEIVKRLGANLEATVTVNTDFGETEADTRQTNLTRFPLFFPEKRDFFLQGSDILGFGLGLGREVIPYFSRRVGLVDGQEVPLRFGGKLAGKVGKTNLAALVVRTGDAFELAPASTMGVVRVKQNVLAESSVGILSTFGDPRGRDGSWLSGADFTYQTSHFRGDKNFLVGVWGLAMDRQDLDEGQSAYGLKVDYPNELWDAAITYKHLSRSFDPSLGFVPRPGTDQLDLTLMYSPRPAWPLVRQMYYQLRGSLVTRLDGSLDSWRVFTAPINWRLESGDGVELNIIPQGEGLVEPFEISDGVVIPPGRYDFVRYRLEGRFASKRKLSGQVDWLFGDFFDGTLDQLQAFLFWTPVRLCTFELSTDISRGTLAQGDFERRLLRGRLRLNLSSDLEVSSLVQYDNESRLLGTNTRLRWTFRPGGDLFVVYNHDLRDFEQGGLRLESNQLLVKVRYELRL